MTFKQGDQTIEPEVVHEAKTSTGGTATAHWTPTAAGTFEITAELATTYCMANATVEVVLPTVDIKEKQGDNVVDPPGYIWKGQTITLKVVPCDGLEPDPNGAYTWTIVPGEGDSLVTLEGGTNGAEVLVKGVNASASESQTATIRVTFKPDGLEAIVDNMTLCVVDVDKLRVEDASNSNNAKEDTDDGGAAPLLFVAAPDDPQAPKSKIKITATIKTDLSGALGKLRYKVEGDATVPADAKGALSQAVEVELDVGGQNTDRKFIVKAGPDLDGNDMLDATEVRRVIEVTDVVIDRLQYRRGGTGDFQETLGPLKVRLFEPVEFKAIPKPSSAIWPPGRPVWGGTSGAAGSGATLTVTFSAVSSTLTDYKTVAARSRNFVFVNTVVCEWVLGVHSTHGAGAPFLESGGPPGHAWISVCRFETPTTIAYVTLGLWPDDHPRIQQDGLNNGAGTDVRLNYGGENLGAIRRFFLLAPEERQALENYLSQVHHWTYWFTCASLAHGAVEAAVGVDVDADDILGFETPRELGEHIQVLEAGDPTSLLNPVAGTPPAPSLNSFDGWNWSSQ